MQLSFYHFKPFGGHKNDHKLYSATWSQLRLSSVTTLFISTLNQLRMKKTDSYIQTEVQNETEFQTYYCSSD